MDGEQSIIRITYLDGVYCGEYVEVDGKAVENGIGVFVWNNGNMYEGEHCNGRRTGNGRMTLASGIVYEGEFVDDRMTGHGKMTWKDGAEYEGEVIDGKLNGKGRLTWPSGEFYIGWFKDDHMNGHGIHYAKGGFVIYDGDWIESCPVNGCERTEPKHLTKD